MKNIKTALKILAVVLLSCLTSYIISYFIWGDSDVFTPSNIVACLFITAFVVYLFVWGDLKPKDKSKQRINAKEWVATTFGDYKRVIQFEDTENCKLIIKGVSPIDFTSATVKVDDVVGMSTKEKTIYYYHRVQRRQIPI